MTTPLRGAITAIVTPFRDDGAVDEEALGRHVEWQVDEGIDGLIPVGSTGEAATLSTGERERVVRITAERVAGRVPVVAGAGANDTAVAIELSRILAKAGATHLMHVSPWYSKPPQRGILAHFRAVADASPVPVVVYNIPGRTASNLHADTTLALAEHPNIVAVKEASGDIVQIETLLRARPKGFALFSGDDTLTLAVMAAGGDGVMSVVSNVVPKRVATLCRTAAQGDIAKAREMHHALAALIQAAFIESNPIPTKAMLAMMGRMRHVLRLPLVPLDPQHQPRMRAALESVGVVP